MRYINFSRQAKPISDFEIEEFFKQNFNNKHIIICNETVLLKYRAAVVQNIIKPFTLRGLDKNKNLIEEVIGKDGKFKYADTQIEGLCISEKYLNQILGI